MKLLLINESFSICHLGPDSALPAWLNYTGYSFVARSPEELSIICPEKMSTPHATVEKGWRCLKVESPPEPLIRTLRVAVVALLTQEGIKTLTVSTFETDYLLFKDADFSRVELALETAGYQMKVMPS